MSETKQTARVLFMPSGKRGDFATGTKVIEAARELGVFVDSVCGTRAICGRCQVTVAEGAFAKHQITSSAENLSEKGKSELRYAEKRDLKEGHRLSCQAEILGDLVIDIPTANSANRQVVRKAADKRQIAHDPLTRLHYVEVEEPDMEKPLGDTDRLLKALDDQWAIENAKCDFPLVPLAPGILRKGQWKVTAAVHDGIDGPRVIALFPGFHDRFFGLAFDIGSTTIAGHLIDMMTGETVASTGSSNPQIRFGEDLMSRVSYVMMNPDGRPALTEAVRAAVSDMIADLCEQAEITGDDILEATFVGNPVMHHLFLGIDPVELGGAPFALTVSGAVDLYARDLDLPVAKSARIHMLPCIAGHVGADAAAATLAEGPHRDKAMTLLVDIGTNAEIVLGNCDHVVAASSPTGPAFEGAEISSGQRAAPGAIERVRINAETLEPRFRIIGCDLWSDEEGFEQEAAKTGVTGICGSAIIEVVAEMYLSGLISEDGVVDGKKQAVSERVVENGRTFAYRLHNDTVDITVTQNDIRAIQLAKAALYAGVKLLMGKLSLEKVDQIHLAGAFGSFIDPKYAMVLGLIPDCDLAKVTAVGNSAGTGARMALINRGYRAEIAEVVNKIEKIETALESDFQEHFVNAMAFPNKVDPFVELEKVIKLPEKSDAVQDDDTGSPDDNRRARRRRRRG